MIYIDSFDEHKNVMTDDEIEAIESALDNPRFEDIVCDVCGNGGKLFYSKNGRWVHLGDCSK